MRKAFSIIGVFILLSGCSFLPIDQEQAENGEQNDKDVYVERPEYKDYPIPESIGDPAPLVEKTNDKAVEYNGEKIIQACNLLSLEDIQEAGVLLHPHTGNGIKRIYFDGKGKGELAKKFNNFHVEGNKCEYALAPDKDEEDALESLMPSGIINLMVFQPSYADTNSLREDIEGVYTGNSKYESLGDMDGVAVYRHKSSDSPRYVLHKGEVWVEFGVSDESEKGEKTAESLLQSVVKRLNEQVEKPTGPSRFEYESPAFTKEVANVCEISDREDYRIVFNEDDSPMKVEEFGTAVGVINYSMSSGDSTKYNYVEQGCRFQSNDYYGDGKALTIHTITYESEKAAQHDMNFNKSESQDVQELNSIGDEAYFSGNKIQTNNVLTFRKGSVVVDVNFTESAQNSSASDVIESLTPIAQKMVERIKD
ncbi:hypothetical protein [Desmospora activa]|uniref:Lipoprotein n=1 Tax=Desmospora activa DSM 45169 TaxID=1121389 RepID=A0A2T4ZCV6_9BACL|nr:hypothetical protein [Desmospora activa]PTM59727.1 hypothetical protein C8J48_2357 [Desmospora activa DSM 45169]